MLNWAHVWTPSWPVHDLNIQLVQKGCRVMGCIEWGIVLDVHKVTSKHPVAHGNIWFLRIWMYRCRFMASPTTYSSLLLPWWISPHTMTDGPRFPSLGWTQATISLSPCAYGAPGPDRHCGIGRSEVPHSAPPSPLTTQRNPFAYPGINITRPFCYLRGKCSFHLIWQIFMYLRPFAVEYRHISVRLRVCEATRSAYAALR